MARQVAQAPGQANEAPAAQGGMKQICSAGQDAEKLRGLIGQVMWVVARKFQFQTFNYVDAQGKGTVELYLDGKEKNSKCTTTLGPSGRIRNDIICVPATAFVATDHLYQLLVVDALPREATRSSAKDLAAGCLFDSSDLTRSTKRAVANAQQQGGQEQRPRNANGAGVVDLDSMDLFGRAVWRLHCSIFKPYVDWCEHQGNARAWPERQWLSVLDTPTNSCASIAAGLMDLCLYFGVWTEAANVRHMPEALWFLYWIMRHSALFEEMSPFGRVGGDQLRLSVNAYNIERLCTARQELRNSLHVEIMNARNSIPVLDGPAFKDIRSGQSPNRDDRVYLDMLSTGLDIEAEKVRSDPCLEVRHVSGAALEGAAASFDFLSASLQRPRAPYVAADTLVLDMIVMGDGGGFTDRIVTPIFQALAYEVAKKGACGVEPALRITYDDANESFVHPANVASILKQHKSSMTSPETLKGLYQTLWRVPQEQNGAVELKAARRLYTGDKERKGWFLKTWQERRTWLALYRAYYRVIAFHVLWFHLLLGLAFAQDTDFKGRWWVGMSGAIVTHLALQLFYAFASIFVISSVPKPPAADVGLNKRVDRTNSVCGVVFDFFCCCLCLRAREAAHVTRYREVTLEEQRQENGQRAKGTLDRMWDVNRVSVRWALWRHILLFLFWLLLTLVLLFLFVAEFSWFPWDHINAQLEEPIVIVDKEPKEFFQDVWTYIAPGYTAVAAALWLVTQRDGYIVTPDSVVSFWTSAWNCFAKCCCQNNRAAQAGTCISNKPKTGVAQFLRNAAFWLAVLGLKFVLDYFVIIRSLPDPIRALMVSDWIGTCGKDRVIATTEVPCVENCILVITLCFPILLVVIFDTGIIYQVVVFLYGCANGLFVLRLGRIVSWDDMVSQFETGVDNFNTRLLSAGANLSWVGFNSAGGQEQSDIVQRYVAFNEAVQKGKNGSLAATQSIVVDLRLADLINSAEESNLHFQPHPLLAKHPYFLKPLVLPPCFSAGSIQSSLDRGSVSRTFTKVLREQYKVFLVLLCEAGFVDPARFVSLSQLAFLRETQNSYHRACRDQLVGAIKKLVTALKSLINTGSTPISAEQKEKKIGEDLIPSFVDLCEHALRETLYAEVTFSGKKQETAVANKEVLQALLAGRGRRCDTLLLEGIIKEPTTTSAANDPQKAPKYRLAPGSLLDKVLHQMATPASDRDSELEDLVCGICGLVRLLDKSMRMTEQEAQPKNGEAQRVLKFFMASLYNASMPTPEPIHLMRSLTTLVPHYHEGVIYPLDAKEVKDRTEIAPKKGEMDDLVSPMRGFEISTVEFMRVQFEDEWANFVERMLEKYDDEGGTLKKVLLERDGEVTEHDFRKEFARGGRALFSRIPGDDAHGTKFREARMDLMLWASDRGQMLARTVKGMMQYGEALVLLGQLEAPPRVPDDGAFGVVDLDALKKSAENKFRHIVSSQVYGASKQSSKPGQQWLAKSTDYLMQQYPAFRVAYLDSVKQAGGTVHPASVLLRWDQGADSVAEVYRVRLPWQDETTTGVVLGEGKPENQNHAMIFCFSEAVQTVDMNQENRLAEAFKMRNLLGEFDTSRKGDRRLKDGDRTVAAVREKLRANENARRIVSLVGFREWIFSGKAGAIGQFAAGAEFAFGTIVQRTMAEPGGARFHYGHPDVWNKTFSMTRGGVSKATKAFHVSEDVFGGYNAIIRGAIVKYREYISVGKARDVGFDQINGFEAKVSGGNGEQSISRDVYRLGMRLDWFRLMSWYHSGIGFFMNSALTMASVYLAVWLVFVFALSDNLTSGESSLAEADRKIIPIISTVQLFQLGLLSIIPYWAELCLETGFITGSANILRQLIAGAPIFFIFRQQTSAYYFTQVATYGGAKYIATGRGFALSHTPYVKLFTAYGRSHIYFGMQLASLALMLAFLGIPSYVAATFGTWLVAVSLFFSPFWFNPNSFSLENVQADFAAFHAWLTGSADPGTKKSWQAFHRESLEKARNASGKQTDHVWNRLGGVLMQIFNAVILVALVEHLLRREYDDSGDEISGRGRKVAGFILFEVVLGALILFATFQASLQARKMQTNTRRVLAVITGVALVALFVLYLTFVGRDASAGFRDYVLLSYANFVLGTIIVQLMLHVAPFHPLSVFIVDCGYYVTDVVVSYILFAIVSLLSLIPIMDSIQALLLFNYEVLKEAHAGRQLKMFLNKRGRFDSALSSGAAATSAKLPGASGKLQGASAKPLAQHPPFALQQSIQRHASGDALPARYPQPSPELASTSSRASGTLSRDVGALQLAPARTSAYGTPAAALMRGNVARYPDSYLV